MALTLDPATKVITIPQADLTLVSGSLYELDTNQFRKDVFDLIASESYIWMPDAFSHNTEVTVAGTTFARTLEFINGYSVTFENLLYSVRLAGSNNNIFDVENGILNASGNVTVIGQNSAGLQTVVSGSGVLPADITAIAAATSDATWDTKTSDHEVVGTFGEELATKSDVAARSSTAYYAKASASLIAGVDVAGTTANIDVRDGVYWHVDEDATTGLTVEYVFNLAAAEEQAGVFAFYGRYTGAPNSHYLEMWAWNVESLAWELLHERFVDNSNSDLEAIHVYHERHIDKVLSNKVIIRMVHNVTGYSANHHLYIDSVELSAVSTVVGGSQQSLMDYGG